MFKITQHPARPPTYAMCFDPATIGIVLTVASTAIQAANTLAAGRAEQAAARARQQALEHQAAQARQNAGQERAAAQRGAFEERRIARFVESRALARAAASGAGAGDPTVENILGDIGAEGEFRALNELFIGEDRARNLEMQADLKIFEGDQERRAGDIARSASRRLAFAQVLSGGARAFGRASDAGLFDRNPGSRTPPIPRRNPRRLQTSGSAGRGFYEKYGFG